MTNYPILLLPNPQDSPKSPDGCKGGKMGEAERRFAHELRLCFPGKVFQGMTLTRYPDYPYIPDFVYFDPSRNLLIDIEIDEPYSRESFEPTHYIGNTREQSRDAWFLEQGWVVIRFAEEQVMRSHRSCCHFIAQVIHQFTGETIPSSLANSPEIISITRWTMSEAEQMAAQKYRMSYQPKKQRKKWRNMA